MHLPTGRVWGAHYNLITIFQQGDDPPFLPVGTDVSAKYKGAFCEAKIKKVVRNIKCKVSTLTYTYIFNVINLAMEV